jgi:beta-phosphoglucomutase-like phosphatase (HAD superfamily)
VHLVVFELDPVLVDGRGARAAALRAACAVHDIPISPLVTDRMLGGPAERAANAVLAASGRHDDALGALLTLTAERLRHDGDAGALRAGAPAFVAAAAAEGRVGIITREPRHRAEALLASAGIADFAAFVWCGDDRARDVVAATRDALQRHAAMHGAGRLTVVADDADRLVAARALGAGTVAVPVAPEEMTPDASWDSFQGRTPADLP